MADIHEKMLNYLVSQRTDKEGTPLPPSLQPGMQYMKQLPPNQMDRFFMHAFQQHLYRIVWNFMEEYESLPSSEAYQLVKQKDHEFKRWLGESSGEEQKALKELERRAFRKVEDEAFMNATALRLLLKLHLSTLLTDSQKELMPDDSDTVEVFHETQQAITHLGRIMETMQGGRELVRVDWDVNPPDPDYTDLNGLTTIYPQIVLQREGLSLLLAVAKVGKTRLMLNIALGLIKDGYHILYFDLENGDREMQMRWEQIVMKDLWGFALPLDCFRAGLFVDVNKMLSKGRTEYDSDQHYNKEDKVFEIVSKTVKCLSEDETYYRYCVEVEIHLKSADSSGPGHLVSWRTHVVKPDNNGARRLNEISSQVFKPMDKKLRKLRKEAQKEYLGRFRIRYINAPKVEEIDAEVDQLIRNVSDPFFNNPATRVLFIDWMQMLIGMNSTEVFKLSRQTYAHLKTMQSKYSVYIFAIEGIANEHEMKSPTSSADRAMPSSNRDIKYRAANFNILLATSEELYTGWSRMIASRSRWKGSGDFVVTYLKTDKHYAEMMVQDEEGHQMANPDFWEARNKEGKKKTKVKTNEYGTALLKAAMRQPKKKGDSE